MIPPELYNSFRDTLLSGGYNLLLGSGISLDSHNGLGEPLRSTEQLRKDLCALKAVGENTALSRVSGMLAPLEREAQLVRRFLNCKPGASLTPFTSFLWKRLFTFNIDDVFERLYATAKEPKQTLIPINYDAAFEPTPTRSELQAVHMHGWVGQPTTPFVFSHAEYARTLRALNPWMHMLAEILPTEAFIIAGTSLNEVDLEYYLSNRNSATPRRGKGPSLLIEPYPDGATAADCERYGLLLIKATFGAFLMWLREEFPSPPTLAEIVIPNLPNVFPKNLRPSKMLQLFADFRLCKAGERPRSSMPSAFLYGRDPTQDDLDEHLDITRADNERLSNDVRVMLKQTKDAQASPKIALLLDDAGTGKTTAISRVATELVLQGVSVMTVNTLSRIDVENAIECFAAALRPIVLVVDHFADHVEQVLAILRGDGVSGNLVVLAAERTYREEYLKLVLGEEACIKRNLNPLNETERTQLLELFREFGLIGVSEGVHNPTGFVNRFKGDPVAIAVCRILNDFRPLDKIVDSLWAATQPDNRLVYLCAALAVHCHNAGIRYSILQKISGASISLEDFYDQRIPLALADNTADDEFVVPLNAVYADRVLHRTIEGEKQQMFDAFKRLASALAPFVNRTAVKMRTPEARLAGRLLDADKIVKPMLGGRANELYEACKKDWAWNSRYWEQRALLVAGEDLETALQYARHAVAIEVHPFTLTTLGKLLFQRVERVNVKTDTYVFAEAFEKLTNAIEMEGARTRSRITIHPFAILLFGTARFLELGGRMTGMQDRRLQDHMGDAEFYFGKDPVIRECLIRLDILLSNSKR